MCPSFPQRKHLLGVLGALVFIGVDWGTLDVMSADLPTAGSTGAIGTSCAAGTEHGSID
jgi:hypothetical protein